MTIRVLIADDHAIVRAGIRLLLASQADFAVVGEATDGREALALAEQLGPDVVLMDIAMPDLNGLEATKELKKRHPGIHVLILTMYEDERYFFETLRSGASGYVVKGAQPQDLFAAIRAVAAGQAYLTPRVTRLLINDYLQRVTRGEEEESYGGLTEREREVLLLIAEGLTSRQIAERLFLSVHTVERHRANIMAKLNLHTRADLIKYAIRKGLIPAEG